jgi:hypothetical protein
MTLLWITTKQKSSKSEGAGVCSVRLAGVGFALHEALHVGFFARLQLDRWALPTGDRLLAQNTD